eukprot:TRINITY_DN6030_c0_g1_i1.p1 TRINITY_DN6030_c0_g1~~TRINITY_DN6030_c0_g1_i1.p1  ORF type:complete len:476 (+),score=64.54 TRINITY_DN6030_c0_g1_i1:40-1467(+)
MEQKQQDNTAKKDLSGDKVEKIEEKFSALTLEECSTMIDTNFVQLKSAITNQDWFLVFNSLQAIRLVTVKISEEDPERPFSLITKIGILPHLIEVIGPNYVQHSNIQSEALWILINVLSNDPEAVNGVVSQNGIRMLLDLLSLSKSPEVIDNCLGVLYNISGEEELSYRDGILDSDAVGILINLYENNKTNHKILTELALLISNLVRGKPYPQEKIMLQLLPLLAQLIDAMDNQTLESTLFTFRYISTASEKACELIIKLNVASKIAKFTLHENKNVKDLAFQTVGDLLSSSDEVVNTFLNAGLLEGISISLKSNNMPNSLRIEILWIVSNIVVSPSDVIAKVLNSDIISIIVNTCLKEETTIRKEALEVIWRLVNSCSVEQFQELMKYQLVEQIGNQLEDSQTNIVLLAVNCLDEMLGKSQALAEQKQTQNTVMIELERLDIISKLEILQSHSSDQVYKSTLKILETYFAVDKE